MSCSTISIFGNKIFSEILHEMKLFSKYNVKYYDDIGLCVKDAKNKNQLLVFFVLKETKFFFSEFEKKVISIIAKSEFKKNSFINLNDYIIDKNERKIKKNNLELQLSEKEINFLILFSKTEQPISKNLVLKSVWNYSKETETHTVETHIHRLRKKILEKFGDNAFIKNNDKGYYI